MQLHQEIIVKYCKRKFNSIFFNKLNKDTDLRMAWDASKTFIRGYFIENNNELKKNQEKPRLF